VDLILLEHTVTHIIGNGGVIASCALVRSQTSDLGNYLVILQKASVVAIAFCPVLD
jgi:hypothetical protein